MAVSEGAPAWLSAKAKETFGRAQVLQNWSHRSYKKKLQWHLAEQLLFLAGYCESGYITFGGLLRTKLTAHNKLNLFFLQKRNWMKARWVESGELQPGKWPRQRFPKEKPQVKNPTVLLRITKQQVQDRAASVQSPS